MMWSISYLDCGPCETCGAEAARQCRSIDSGLKRGIVHGGRPHTPPKPPMLVCQKPMNTELSNDPERAAEVVLALLRMA